MKLLANRIGIREGKLIIIYLFYTIKLISWQAYLRLQQTL